MIVLCFIDDGPFISEVPGSGGWGIRVIETIDLAVASDQAVAEAQRLVAEGVHDPAERRDDVPATGQGSVQRIGHGGDHEQGHRKVGPGDAGLREAAAAEGGDKPAADGDKKEGEDKKPAEEKK